MTDKVIAAIGLVLRPASRLAAVTPHRKNTTTTPHRIATHTILITRRGPGGPKPGAWEFPGGKAEPDESPHDCVIREIREEVALEVLPAESLGIFTHTYPHATVELHPWLCLAPPNAVPRPVQVTDCRWVSPSELPVPGFLAGNTPIIEALRHRLTRPLPPDHA